MIPKISVLIPLYNRKHYVADTVDSVLRQTFQDFEIIIRDDCSTDGSYDFVAEKYSEQISSGRVKLLRNKMNLGEGGTVNNLFRDAIGKYLTILHSDDMYFPHALETLFVEAEKYQADVVHSSVFLNTAPDGIIEEGTTLYPTCWEKNPPKETEVYRLNPSERFQMWGQRIIFHDAQYNIYNRKFILDNEIIFDTFDCEHLFFALQWIMQAKCFVRIQGMFYVRRDAPDSGTNATIPAAKFEKCISNKIEMSFFMDKFLDRIDFFRENPEAKFFAVANVLKGRDWFDFERRGIYRNGVTPEMHDIVEKVFKKYFGYGYFYPMFLFQWLHVLPFNKSLEVVKN